LAQERSLLIFAFLMTGLILAVMTIYIQMDATVALAMRADGLTEVDYGSAAALNGLVIVLLSLAINQYMRRFSPFWALAAGALLLGAGFGWFALAFSFPTYAVGVVVFTMGEIVSAPVAPAIMAELSPPHRRGFYQGLLGAGYGLSAFVGPVVGGQVFSRLGSDALWIGCLILGALVAAGFLWVMRPMYERLKAKTRA
jgi:MFS family permease